MHNIHKPSQYPTDVLTELQQMSPLAIDIANRWSRDWPSESTALIEAGQFLDALKSQEASERRAIQTAIATGKTAEAVAARYFLFPDPPAVATVETTDIPESGPWQGSPHCVMEASEPYEVDGKLVRAIKSRHSDGFICLRFEEVDLSAESENKKSEHDPQTSIWS